jgi:CubicO group peptidase (beta-lactamase class C family)
VSENLILKEEVKYFIQLKRIGLRMDSKLFKPIIIAFSLISYFLVSFTPSLAAQPKAIQFQGPSDSAEFEAFIDRYMAEQIDTHHIPGVVFTMVKDGEVFFSKGYGYANLENQVPINPEDTILTTASVSKVFTALSVLQLQDKGMIDLNEDVHPYITGFHLPDNYPGGPTFANLLTHTDGFETRMIGIAVLNEEDLRPLGDMLEMYTPSQIYPPGEIITYSDFAANLGGHLVAEISGFSFEEYMDNNVLAPLEMIDSTYDQRLSEEMRAKLAQGYEYQNGKNEPIPFFYIAYSPMGGLRTTAADMNHFMLALLNGGEYHGKRILSEAATQSMFTQQFTSHPKMAGISYGLFEHLENGRQLFLRDGDGVGTRSRMVFFPEENLGFYIFYNSGENALRLDIISAILDQYYPSVEEGVPIGLPNHKERAEMFSGTYRFSNADTTTFGKSMLFFSQLVEVTESKEGYLILETASLMGGEKSSVMGGFEGVSKWLEVEPLYFERVNGKGQIAFELDEDGNVAYLYSGQGYHSPFSKLSWYETQSFHIILIEVVSIMIASMVIYTFILWPLGALANKLQKKSSQDSWISVVARLWSGLVCGMLALFVIRAIGVLYAIGAIGNIPNFAWGVSNEMVGALNSVYLPAALALALPFFTILSWRKAWWNIPIRVHYTLVTLAVFAGIWWTHYWNLLGFHM